MIHKRDRSCWCWEGYPFCLMNVTSDQNYQVISKSYTLSRSQLAPPPPLRTNDTHGHNCLNIYTGNCFIYTVLKVIRWNESLWDKLILIKNLRYCQRSSKFTIFRHKMYQKILKRANIVNLSSCHEFNNWWRFTISQNTTGSKEHNFMGNCWHIKFYSFQFDHMLIINNTN